MVRLNLRPDFKRITGEHPDQMVDEDTGKTTFIIPRVSRFHGRGNAVIGGLSKAQGSFATLRVFGDPLWGAFYDRRKVKAEGLDGLNNPN